MTVHKKTLFIISVTIVISILILFGMSRFIVLRSFATLEKQYAQEQIERVRRALFDDFTALDTFLFDWAAWDDTYDFVEDGNEEYIESNLVNETFISARLNLMIFINISGEMIFGKALDLENKKEVAIPQSVRQHLSESSPLLHHPDIKSRVTGILLLPEGTMLAASRPVLTSEEKGPIRGALIMGRYLNSGEVDRLAEITHQSLSMYRIDDSAAPYDFQQARSLLSPDTPTFVRPLNTKSIAGYTLIEDIYGKPALLVRTDMPRSIYSQGRTSVLHLIFSVLGVGLVLGVVMLLLLEKVVLSRLDHLNAHVTEIRTHEDLSKRVLVQGKDELSSLATSINDMLNALEHSQKDLQESEALYRGLVETSPDAIMVTDLRGKLTLVNHRAAKLHGYESVEEMLEHASSGMAILQNTQFATEEARQILEAGNVRQVECIIRKKDNTKFPAEISTSVLVDTNSHPIAFIDIVRDITKRKQIKEELEKYRDRLEKLVKERTTALTETNQQLRTELATCQKEVEQLRRNHG